MPYATGASLVARAHRRRRRRASTRCSRATLLAAAGRRCCATSLFALLVDGALLVYFSLRAKALSPAIAEARLQALQARIRPHFLFNSINAVLSLVRTDPQAGRRRRCTTWPTCSAC